MSEQGSPATPRTDGPEEPSTEAGRDVIAQWSAGFLNGLDLHSITDLVVAVEMEAAERVQQDAAAPGLREATTRIRALLSEQQSDAWNYAINAALDILAAAPAAAADARPYPNVTRDCSVLGHGPGCYHDPAANPAVAPATADTPEAAR